MSEKEKKKRIVSWADLIFWGSVIAVFIALYEMGILDFAAYRHSRPWF